MSQRHPTPGPGTALVASLALGLLAAPASAADEVPGPGELDDLGEMSLEDLLNADVITVTKSRQRASQTPAVVTVVTGDEIRARGYGSLAEALRAVPGFYDVPDLVSHNIGIRGINGGPNASGNVVKLMIDGHPVDYRPTTGNFFGEELLPLEVIDRLEIIRGPASALYGANAFLGVVNVITRSGEALKGLRLIGHGVSVRDRIGGGGGVVIGMSEGRLDLLLGARILYQDRSGLDLPSSSPLLPNEAVTARGPSRNDTSRSGTLFGKLSVYNVLAGKLTFLASLQSLDAHGEFQSFGPLTHDSRIALLNQNYRLSHESARFNLSAHYFRGAPTGKARLNIGRPDYVLLPSVAAEGFGVAGESHFQPHDRLKLTFGADFVSERHMVETFDQKLIAPVVQADGTVLHAAGTIIPGQNHGERRALSNVAAFAQSLLTLNDDWSGIVGLRGDHNSLYRRNLSARAGIVYAPSSISVKLLYGSSFKAPSAQQLYAQPYAFGALQGVATVAPQTAHTFELAGAVRLPEGRGDLSLNVFANKIVNRVEFLPVGNFTVAQNIQNQWVAGGELDSRLMITRTLRLRISAGVARTVARETGPILIGRPEIRDSLFPTFQAHTIVDHTLPWGALQVSGEASYIASRPASFSNVLRKGSSYDLDGYAVTALVLSGGSWRWLSESSTSASLRVVNLLNTRWVEPGFGGIDLPTPGISALLTIVHRTL